MSGTTAASASAAGTACRETRAQPTISVSVSVSVSVWISAGRNQRRQPFVCMTYLHAAGAARSTWAGTRRAAVQRRSHRSTRRPATRVRVTPPAPDRGGSRRLGQAVLARPHAHLLPRGLLVGDATECRRQLHLGDGELPVGRDRAVLGVPHRPAGCHVARVALERA